MLYCQSCGAPLPDGANYCPYCRAVQQRTNNTYQRVPNTPHDTNIQTNRDASGFNRNSAVSDLPPDAQQFYFQQQLSESINDAATAKTLGIITIICAVITSFAIVGWVCGALGIAKANSAMRFAQQIGNAQLYFDANRAKTLNVIGLVISGVLTVIGVLAMLLFAVSTGYEGNF